MYQVTLVLFRLYLLFSPSQGRVEGREHVPPQGPFIVVVSHHTRSSDPWRVSHAFGLATVIRWYANWELMDFRHIYARFRLQLPPGIAYLTALLYTAVVRHSKTIPVNRDVPAARVNVRALRETSTIMKTGGIIGIFGEGGWNRREARPVFVGLAQKYGVPLIHVELERYLIRVHPPLFVPESGPGQSRSDLARKILALG